MALRKASVESKRIDLATEGDWIEVRTDIAKRDFNRFIKYLPGRDVGEDGRLTPAEAVELQAGMFEALVVAWSLPDPATVEEYLALSNEGASELDEVLAEHFKSLQPTKQEEKVGFRPE